MAAATSSHSRVPVNACTRSGALSTRTASAHEQHDAEDHERHAQPLADRDQLACFVGRLRRLHEFHEDAHAEDQHQHPAQQQAARRLRAGAHVDRAHHEERQQVAEGFVELRRMSRQRIDRLEHHAPGTAGRVADDLGVQEVGDADEDRCQRRGDRHAIEQPGERQLQPATGQPHARDHADHAAVAGQPAFPYPQDRKRVRQVVAGLVEQAVDDARTDHRTDQRVHQQRVGMLLGHVFAAEHAGEDALADEEAADEQQPVPAQRNRPDLQRDRIEIPVDQHARGLFLVDVCSASAHTPAAWRQSARLSGASFPARPSAWPRSSVVTRSSFENTRLIAPKA